jgi:hypothetical protein
MDDCLNEGVVPKNTIFIMCDDFIYSGQQMSESISLLSRESEHIESLDENDTQIRVYACIVGQTSVSKQKFSRNSLFELRKLMRCKTNYYFEVIFPKDIIIVNKNLRNIVMDKMNIDNETREKVEYEDNEIIEYVRKKSIYYPKVINNKLYGVQFFNNMLPVVDEFIEVGSTGTSLVYLFFKYPDGWSTIQTMCTIFNKNINVIYLDNFSKKLNYSLINYETVFQVTPELLPMSINEKDMNEICSFFETTSNINASLLNGNIRLFYLI